MIVPNQYTDWILYEKVWNLTLTTQKSWQGVHVCFTECMVPKVRQCERSKPFFRITFLCWHIYNVISLLIFILHLVRMRSRAKGSIDVCLAVRAIRLLTITVNNQWVQWDRYYGQQYKPDRGWEESVPSFPWLSACWCYYHRYHFPRARSSYTIKVTLPMLPPKHFPACDMKDWKEDKPEDHVW